MGSRPMQVWRQTASSGELVACVWAAVVDVVGVDRAGSGRPGAGSKACANVLYLVCIFNLGAGADTREGHGHGVPWRVLAKHARSVRIGEPRGVTIDTVHRSNDRVRVTARARGAVPAQPQHTLDSGAHDK